MEPSRVTRELLQLLGEKWTLALLDALAVRPHRFSELRRRFTLTAKALSRTLCSLEAGGLIVHLEFPGFRRHVYYDATATGRELRHFITMFDERFVDRGALRTRPRRLTATAAARSESGVLGPFIRGDQLSKEDTTFLMRFLSLAVRDLSASSMLLSRIFSAPVSPQRDAPIITSKPGIVRWCGLGLPHYFLGVVQPISGPTPHQDFVDRFGNGILHLGLSTAAPLEPLIARLERRGAKRTARNLDRVGARVDFREQLGVAMALGSSQDSAPAPEIAAADEISAWPADALARQRLTNVGIIVRNIRETASYYAEILGLGVTAIRTVDLPSSGDGSVTSKARIAYLRQEGVAIKLLEPQSGPLKAFAKKYGPRAHHIGFEVGEHFTAIVARLVDAGGTPVAGRADCGYLMIDFGPQLGIALELTGRPAITLPDANS